MKAQFREGEAQVMDITRQSVREQTGEESQELDIQKSYAFLPRSWRSPKRCEQRGSMRQFTEGLKKD